MFQVFRQTTINGGGFSINLRQSARRDALRSIWVRLGYESQQDTIKDIWVFQMYSVCAVRKHS